MGHIIGHAHREADLDIRFGSSVDSVKGFRDFHKSLLGLNGFRAYGVHPGPS